MHCRHVKLPNGTGAIVCESGRKNSHICIGCGGAATLQCDWKVAKGLTCDAWICPGCAQEVGPDKHLCPKHQLDYKDWLAKQAGDDPRSTSHESP